MLCEPGGPSTLGQDVVQKRYISVTEGNARPADDLLKEGQREIFEGDLGEKRLIG